MELFSNLLNTSEPIGLVALNFANHSEAIWIENPRKQEKRDP